MLNALTRRSLEGGLLDRYSAQLIWITSLRSKMIVGDGEEDLYFVFSLSHLSPAFCLKECHPRCVYQNYSRSMIKE
jgi:hypothetical protein